MLIELTKLAPSGDAVVEPGSWETYIPGSADNKDSLPVDYVLVGFLLEPIKLGRPIRLLRVARNGVAALGIFESTSVTAVTSTKVTTRNSLYTFRILAES